MLASTKRRATALIVALGVVAMASAAYAYWTAGGSGTGSASTGSTTPLTAKQTGTLTPMYPGDAAQTISGNFDNPNAGPVYVTSVTVSIASVAKAAGAPAGTCDATDYTLGSATMAVGREVAKGTGVDAFTGATIKFNNKSVDQNACKNATVNLAYAIN